MSLAVVEGYLRVWHEGANAVKHADALAIVFVFVIRIARHVCVGADDGDVLN